MKLRQCCCCCSLKTGTTIVGVLNILAGLRDLIIGIIAPPTRVFVGVGAGLAVLGAILLLVSILLIIGAQKGDPALLEPWLVYTIVFLIANTILYIFMAVPMFATVASTALAYIIVTGVAISFLFQTYFLLVVYSLYRELKGTAPPTGLLESS